MPPTAPMVFTVGHSTRTLAELLALLRAHEVSVLADVRTVPRSRHVPQFNTETMGPDLSRRGIEDVHLPLLGGLRKTRADSTNLGWRNASFRGYADYMQTPALREGLDELLRFAATKPTAIMCAEAVPWRCHRSMSADALIARGWQVIDLMSERSAKPHTLTKFAKINGTQVTTRPSSGLASLHSPPPSLQILSLC